MLKMTGSSNKPAPSKNDDSKSASSRNNNSKPVFERNDGNSEVDGFDVGGNGIKYAKKSGKSSKSRKLKSKKTSKSQNLAKSRKKLLKSENSPNFDAMEAGPKFLTPDARTAFNRLWLAFTKVLILQHFDLKCYIWIETDALNYIIGGVLNQLTSGTNPNGVVTKTDLGQ